MNLSTLWAMTLMSFLWNTPPSQYGGNPQIIIEPAKGQQAIHITSVSFSPQGSFMLVVSSDQRLRVFQFVLPHRSLRQQRRLCTPAMAIGLVDPMWSYRDYVWHPVHPDPQGKAAMEDGCKNFSNQPWR